MANADNPTGFVYNSIDRPEPPATRTFIKLVGVGTAIFINDVTELVASSTLSQGKGGLSPFITPGTTIPLGVSLTFGAASTKTRHTVIIDRDAIYHAQDDGDTDGVAATEANLNANVSLGAGSTTTAFSGHEIDEASIAVTGTLDLQFMGLYQDPGGLNAFGSSHVRMLCKFNKSRYAPATVGV